MPTNPTELSTERPELKRAITGFGFFALAFGSMIGVGWITALGSWFEQAGPVGAIIAFAAGGTLMLVIGLCYAEVTPMLPVTGGEVAYAYKAFGTSKAFIIGWFLAFGYLSVSAFEAISVGLVLSFLFHHPGEKGCAHVQQVLASDSATVQAQPEDVQMHLMLAEQKYQVSAHCDPLLDNPTISQCSWPEVV